MITLKYFDVTLLVVAGVFAVLADLPMIGYAFAAGAWIVTRVIAEYLDRRAIARQVDLRARLSTHFAGMMARVLTVALAVVLAKVVGTRDDAVMAAALSLIVFTVYLGTSAFTRQLERNVVRP